MYAEDGIWFSAQKVRGHHFIIPLFMEWLLSLVAYRIGTEIAVAGIFVSVTAGRTDVGWAVKPFEVPLHLAIINGVKNKSNIFRLDFVLIIMRFHVEMILPPFSPKQGEDFDGPCNLSGLSCFRCKMAYLDGLQTQESQLRPRQAETQNELGTPIQVF